MFLIKVLLSPFRYSQGEITVSLAPGIDAKVDAAAYMAELRAEVNIYIYIYLYIHIYIYINK